VEVRVNELLFAINHQESRDETREREREMLMYYRYYM